MPKGGNVLYFAFGLLFWGAPVEIAFPVRLCRMEKLNAELLTEIHKT
jgi:hypothetical protein